MVLNGSLLLDLNPLHLSERVPTIGPQSPPSIWKGPYYWTSIPSIHLKRSLLLDLNASNPSKGPNLIFCWLGGIGLQLCGVFCWLILSWPPIMWGLLLTWRHWPPGGGLGAVAPRKKWRRRRRRRFPKNSLHLTWPWEHHAQGPNIPFGESLTSTSCNSFGPKVNDVNWKRFHFI